MDLDDRIRAFVKLGIQINNISDDDAILSRAYQQNNWFTKENISHAASVWAKTLTKENIEKWLVPYRDNIEAQKGRGGEEKKVGVINAGNIPFVALHDFISILISGNEYVGKNSSDDSILMPHVANLLCETEPRFKSSIQFTERLTSPDAVIATGSNNTSRYFKYYFSKYPHIIRKNRNGVAVLNGNESSEELQALGKDIFQYFGLGCRSVSKLYLPRDYDLKVFFESIFSFSGLMQHNKYMNNFEYSNAVLLLKRIPFLQNGFLIVFEDVRIPSPIAVLHYEFYDSIKELEENLHNHKEKIQCIVSSIPLSNVQSPLVQFGETQTPALWDYADGVDTMQFLSELSNHSPAS
jgi:hypothetical protein